MVKISKQLFNFPMERFEIFTICRRPPVLQTDAGKGMMKIVVRETEARKASGRRTSTPDNSVSKHCCGRVRMAIPAPLLALSACKI